MNGWQRMGLGFSALWVLFWLGWTVDIYLTDDILPIPFVELALAIPLLGSLAGVLVARILNALGRIRRKPSAP